MLPRHLIPDDLYPSAFIAGGYAACPALASDCDVWVGERRNLEETRQAWLTHLRRHFPATAVREENQVEEFEYQGIVVQILKVAYVQAGTKYHLMVTDGPVCAVLENFDVSTHQLALTPSGIVLGPQWTPITEPPIKLMDTPHTEVRMAKITARYGRVNGE